MVKRYRNYMILANDFLEQGRESKALRAFQQALGFAETEKERLDALYEIGDLYVQSGYYDKGREIFEEILACTDKGPLRAGAYYGLAMINDFEEGDLDTSITYYEKAVEMDGDYDRAWYYLGHAQWEKGRLHLAEMCFRKCLDLDPMDFVTASDLGSLYEEQGDFEAAKALLTQSLRIAPNYARGLFNMGVVMGRLGHKEEALRYYERSLEERPHPHTYLNMSALFIERGDDEASLRICREGMENFPDSVNLHYNAACSLVHLGREEEAYEELLEAIAIVPEAREWAIHDEDLKDLCKEKGARHDHH